MSNPFAPGDGYIWTPGYWAYGDYGFFWVVSTYSPSVLWTVTNRSNMRVSIDFSSQSYPPNLVPTESRGRQRNLCRRGTDRPAPGLVFWALRYDLAVRCCAFCQQRYQLPAIVTELVQEANQLIRTLEWLAMVFPFLHDYSPLGLLPPPRPRPCGQPRNAPPASSSTCGTFAPRRPS